MSKKLTPWFPPTVKPVHIGCYQTEDSAACLRNGMHGYQYWTGARWGRFEITKTGAEASKSSDSTFQVNYWRGLAVKP